MKNLLWMLVICGLALAAADTQPNFSGKWQLDASKTEGSRLKGDTMLIQQDDTSIAVTNEDGGKTIAEFKCETNGRNCKARGDIQQVSVYYNGPTLVELDTTGHDRVIKKRIHMTPDGRSLQIDVMHVNPPGPPEKLIFTKQ
jgi:hypothetical protein